MVKFDRMFDRWQRYFDKFLPAFECIMSHYVNFYAKMFPQISVNVTCLIDVIWPQNLLMMSEVSSKHVPPTLAVTMSSTLSRLSWHKPELSRTCSLTRAELLQTISGPGAARAKQLHFMIHDSSWGKGFKVYVFVFFCFLVCMADSSIQWLILSDEGSALTVCSGRVIKDSCLAFCHNFVF